MKWAAVAAVLIAGFLFWELLPLFRPLMVAVAPFDDSSGDASKNYVRLGLAEDISKQLGRMGSTGFGVIESASVNRYAGLQTAPQQLAADLGASYILTGRIQREGSQTRLFGQLVRTRDEKVVWKDSFVGPSNGIPTLEQDIAVAVARTLRSPLSLKPIEVHTLPPIDPLAMDSYWNGRFYWNKRTEQSLKDAIVYFEQTNKLTNGFAPAYSGIADSYAALVYLCYLSPAEGFYKARVALDQARELDKDSPQVVATAGYLSMYSDWNFQKARQQLEHAIELDRNYAPAYDWLGVLDTAMKDFPAASSALETASTLDPPSLPIRTDIGFEQHYSGDNEKAEKSLQYVINRDHNFALGYFWLGRVYSAEGNCEKSLMMLGAVAPGNPMQEWQPYIAAHGYVAATCGDPNAARRDLSILEAQEKTRFVTSYGKALIYAGLRDREQTLRWLGKAIDEHSHWLVWINLDPRFNAFRSDPQFKKIAQEVFPVS